MVINTEPKTLAPLASPTSNCVDPGTLAMLSMMLRTILAVLALGMAPKKPRSCESSSASAWASCFCTSSSHRRVIAASRSGTPGVPSPSAEIVWRREGTSIALMSMLISVAPFIGEWKQKKQM
eukprot:1156621-Pelagomonas_calceolata.AAC.5